MIPSLSASTGFGHDSPHYQLSGDGKWWFQIALLVSCTVSVVCCLVVIGTFTSYKSLRRHPNSLVIARCACDLLFYLQFVFSGLQGFLGTSGGESSPGFRCQWLAFYTQALVIASELYFGCLSLDLALSLTNPFNNFKLRGRLMHLGVMCLSVVMGLVVALARYDDAPLYGSDNYLTVCWIKSQNLGSLNVNPFTWALFYVPLTIIFFASLAVLVAVRVRIRAGVPHTARVRLQAFRMTLRYLVGLFPYWVLTASVLFASQRNEKSIALRIVFALVFGARDLVVLLIWLWTNDLKAARELKARHRDEAGADIDLSPALNNALKQEVMMITSLGIATAVNNSRSAARRSYMSPGLPASSVRVFDLRRDKAPLDTFTLRSLILGKLPPIVQPQRTTSIAQLVPKASALGSSTGSKGSLKSAAKHGTKGRLAATKRNGHGSSAPLLPRRSSKPHLDLNPSRLSALARQTKAEGSTGKARRQPPAATHRDVRRALELEHSQDDAPDDYATTGYKVKGTLFRDYDEGTFKHVRAALGITDEDYVTALSETVAANFSGGSSGAFMYFTKDKRYVVKTLTRTELVVLRGMLHEYCAYIQNRPNSLLTKFLGCYSVRLYGKTLYFCVMTNMLFSGDRKAQDVYDLKGSRVNRSAGPPAKGSLAYCRHCSSNFRVGKRGERCPARLRHPHVAVQTLKDNDLKFKLRLGAKRRLILAQIEEDASFLRNHGIMDYSLLLGVCRAKFRVHGDSGGPGTRLRQSSTVSLMRSSTRSRGSPSPRPTSGVSAVSAVSTRTSSSHDEETKADFTSPSSSADTGAPARSTAAGPTGLTTPLLSPSGAREPSFAYSGPSELTAYHGGVAAALVEGPEMYFLGIIDILQQWDTSKKLERFAKTKLRCKDGDGISAVPPKHYYKRFVHWIRHEVVDGPEDDDDFHLSDHHASGSGFGVFDTPTSITSRGTSAAVAGTSTAASTRLLAHAEHGERELDSDSVPTTAADDGHHV